MAINGASSMYDGPGGSTRRLHHQRPETVFKATGFKTAWQEGLTFADGGEPGSTCAEKRLLFARDGTAVMDQN